MSYCPKCGNKVDETMVFCPHCGTSLKGVATYSQVPPAEQEIEMREQEKNQNLQKDEKHEKNEYRFLGYLSGV